MQRVFDFNDSLPVRPRRPERLFYAFFPDLEACGRIERFSDQYLRANPIPGTRIKSERLHVSLHHLGDYARLRTKYIYAGIKAGNSVSTPPFQMTFRFVKSFAGRPPRGGQPPRRPLVLLGESEELTEFHRVVGDAMEQIGLRAATRFTPHMTLLYGPKPAIPRAIEPICFEVREFALIHSERWLGRYTTIQRWPLRA